MYDEKEVISIMKHIENKKKSPIALIIVLLAVLISVGVYALLNPYQPKEHIIATTHAQPVAFNQNNKENLQQIRAVTVEQNKN